MALTDLQLAHELRAIVDDDDLEEPLAGIIQRLNAGVTDVVETYASAAPQSVKDLAVVRAAGWLFDSSPGRNFGNCLDLSGARGLLAPYRVRRARSLA